ncbi:MAG TPA: sigma 54-interacting transcriptional regulator, partial [Gemmatales bacterium]|nr:sigma 54-interacting transcriptional regulator [Gemmatales bacterium]
MSAHAYVVLRRGNGFGNVIKLQPGTRYVIGRAETIEIMLHDELCSRQHAAIEHVNGEWFVHDLGSLNGTRVNHRKIEGTVPLRSGDEISLGRSRLYFVHELADLPPQQPATELSNGDDPLNIVTRLGQTRYDLNTGATMPQGSGNWFQPDVQRMTLQLSLLYRLALKMGAASSQAELIEVVLRELLDATPADAAAVLFVTPKQEVRIGSYLSSDRQQTYCPVPATILQEVLQTKQAVLAEDKNRLRSAASEGSRASSLICAAVSVADRVDFIIHLSCSNPLQALGPEDLELSMAVGKQLGVSSQGLRRQLALHEEITRLKAQVATEVQLIGASPAVQAIEEQIMRVGPTSATVLIRGESGVGKELVARAIHLSSPRRSGPFVCLNCAALAESLLESELFGHEKGAFTGATDRKIGKFEAASGGTIFLDEIGEMPPSAQAKLLRILEGHPHERVGGSEPVRVQVRVVAATNRPLEEAVADGLFRRDLYFRLQVIEIRVPPLRERLTDIPLLADYFLGKFNQETGRKIRGFTPAAI